MILRVRYSEPGPPIIPSLCGLTMLMLIQYPVPKSVSIPNNQFLCSRLQISAIIKVLPFSIVESFLEDCHEWTNEGISTPVALLCSFPAGLRLLRMRFKCAQDCECSAGERQASP